MYGLAETYGWLLTKGETSLLDRGSRRWKIVYCMKLGLYVVTALTFKANVVFILA